MAWEEKCIGCLCNNCFHKDDCCKWKDGSSCRKRKSCKEYDIYIPELEEGKEIEEE